jgi:histone H3/H4
MPPKPQPSTGAVFHPNKPSPAVSAAVKAAAAISSAAAKYPGVAPTTTASAQHQANTKVPPSAATGAGNIRTYGQASSGGGASSSKISPVVNNSTIGNNSIKFSSASPTVKKHISPTKSSTSAASGGGANGSNGGATSSTSSMLLNQLKIKKGEIAKRELKEMNAMERAFREDALVWNGPDQVVFPKRYHSEMGLTSVDAGGGGSNGDKKGGGSGEAAVRKSKNLTYYGSQSQGWMYGEGYAGIGGRSWMEAMRSEKKKGEDVGASADANKTTKQPATTTTTTTATPNGKQNGFLMDDVTIIENALKANGLSRKDLTPKAYACFLEQARRYALELLADAQDYAMHANRSTLPTLLPADLLLAADLRGDVNGIPSSLPTYDEMIDYATDVNRAPLPPIPVNCYNGVALPPVEQQLTARTFDVVNGARVAQRMLRGGDVPLTAVELGLVKRSNQAVIDAAVSSGGVIKTSDNKKSKQNSSYGAGRGRQIAVHIKSSKQAGDASAATGTTASASGASGVTKGGDAKSQKRKLTEL